ncbi:16S rRNA (guanine(527)-N(7))-methyltransferase RsmG [soil metagenome]
MAPSPPSDSPQLTGQTPSPASGFQAAEPLSQPLPAHLDLWQQSLGWQPTEAQQNLFQQLYAQILAGNQQLNLTRITGPDEFWEKHLWDSLSGLAPWIAEEAAAVSPPEDDDMGADQSPIRMIDIGTGAGFPGIPAAIALSPLAPIDLTLVEATRKKVQFLKTLCHQLGLPATCIAARAEALGQQSAHRARYDLALVRAVGSAATCAEYALPLLTTGGQAVLFRGQWSTDDTEALLPVIELLGGELTDLQSWQTPLTQSSRHCLFIHKVRLTPPDFPRAVGVPGKHPLT